MSVRADVTDPETGALVRLPLTSKLEVEVMEDMAGPVHMYYVLTDYFQNYIRYVGAVSYNQLHGDRNASTTNCVAQKRLDVPDRSKLPNNGGINPCGLAAWAYFNDTFDNFEARPLPPPARAWCCDTRNGPPCALAPARQTTPHVRCRYCARERRTFLRRWRWTTATSCGRRTAPSSATTPASTTTRCRRCRAASTSRST